VARPRLWRLAKRFKTRPLHLSHIELPEVVQLAVIVVFASKHIHAVVVETGGVTGARRGFYSRNRINHSPLVSLQIESMNFACPAAILETAVYNHSSTINTYSMLIDLNGLVNPVCVRNLCPDGVPVERLHVKAEHLVLVVVTTTHNAADQVHVLSCDNCLVVSDRPRELTTHL